MESVKMFWNKMLQGNFNGYLEKKGKNQKKSDKKFDIPWISVIVQLAVATKSKSLSLHLIFNKRSKVSTWATLLFFHFVASHAWRYNIACSALWVGCGETWDHHGPMQMTKFTSQDILNIFKRLERDKKSLNQKMKCKEVRYIFNKRMCPNQRRKDASKQVSSQRNCFGVYSWKCYIKKRVRVRPVVYVSVTFTVYVALGLHQELNGTAALVVLEQYYKSTSMFSFREKGKWQEGRKYFGP